MLLVECDAGPFLDFNGRNLEENDLVTDKRAWNKTKIKENFTSSILLDFSFEFDFGTVETTSSGPRQLNFWFTASNFPVRFEKPKEHVTMAACLSPAFYHRSDDEQGADGANGKGRKEMTLMRWLEWREHMRLLGVERVNWYGRHRNMRDFVDLYNDLQGTQDTFRSVTAFHHTP